MRQFESDNTSLALGHFDTVKIFRYYAMLMFAQYLINLKKIVI